MRIAKDGLSIISFIFVLGLAFLAISFTNSLFLILSVLMFVFLAFTIFFFRDPEREVGKNIVSPADGKVIKIEKIKDSDVGDSIKVSIFMSILDVHVNRMPMDGKILKIERVEGKFFPAYSEESEKNEKNIILAETKIGKIKIIQIAGIFARRIVCYVKEGENIAKGERIGMIKFGSRVDLILPKDKVRLRIRVNDKLRAGVDEIAELND
ncbi:MAG TPA: phosphatidylserine decarboxylase [Thermoplasmatales archaeon]|nr:phosphatidylserine decarboxylase [Thermoplasmatales archaeon]